MPGSALRVGGLAGSSPALLAAALAEDAPNRLWIMVAPDPPAGEALHADIEALLEPGRAAYYPQRETLTYEAAEHHLEVSGLRVEALESVLAGQVRLLVTTPRALQERAEIPTALTELRLSLRVGQALSPAELGQRLLGLGFERVPLVEGVGEFAQRGGIVDLFGFGAPEPIRVEFWGDEIASIRAFDILDQRSTGELQVADVLPVDFARPPEPEREPEPGMMQDARGAEDRPGSRSAALGSGSEDTTLRRSLLDVLPRDAVFIELAAGHASEEFAHTWSQVVHLHDAEKRRGGAPEAPQELFLMPAQAEERLGGFGRIQVVAHGESDVRFLAREAEAIERDMEALAALLRVGAARGEETLILCDNAGQIERLEEILGGKQGAHGLPPRTTLALGPVSHGFVLEGAEPFVRILTDHEIFKRDRRLRRGRRFRGAVALESLSQLKPGDYVVHMDHGVGRFMGLERVRVGEQEIEALALEYAGGETLRVPVYRLDLIERWVPDREDGSHAPRLHKIGGKAWKTLKGKTEAAIREMAAELLQLYAARQMSERPPFEQDTRWQMEMESAFLYEDTPDQRQATADVKRDLEGRHPMDRLLCGDVGYGKTEVAIRAAFKIVQAGKQVAVLAPTTILAEQHLHTFRQRLAGFPVRIEALSRFRTAKEQDVILAALFAGEVDVVVGTHRLLEPDVVYKDLGLLVVDEEQRFGVKQKERLKEIKHNIDVLSMTATPIPRTLHFSLTGLRDLSLLQTPPRDRMPIITHVLPWVDEVLEDAIRRELDRGGQVFFVHNRVQTILNVAEAVHYLVPDASLAVAHGQMPPAELDEIVSDFIDGKTQILVTTAIIENGMDVPTANTMIVDRADQFGLAQLYQLRGRVGRSHHRAYCYLLVPEGVNEDAEKRLRILEHFTELGSGYAIALKDLELRGAGNILGSEQSGFVHAVGLDTYTRLLEDTIARLKGEKKELWPPPEVSMDGAAYLPDSYVPEGSQKLHLYRRISRMETPQQVTALRAELRDRFGPLPPEVARLLDAAALRLLGARLGVERVLIREHEARVNFRAQVEPRLTALQGAFRDQQIEVEVRRAAPLSLVLRRYGAEPLTATLAGAFDLLATAA
ncbi:MAG TPA: transcription-repair coupling factor [Longimicrobiales bacterium]